MTTTSNQQSPRGKNRPAKPALGSASLWIPIAVVVVAAAALIIWLLWDGKGDQEPDNADPAGIAQVEENVDTPADEAPVAPGVPEQEPEQPDLTELERHDPQDPLAFGDEDAPVTMIVFSDYQCPYCSAWSADSLPSMMEYVEEGDLRIEWRDLDVFGPSSLQAAQAAYAAALQDEFLEYHHQLLPDGEVLSESQLSSDALIELAGDIGLDAEQFAEDLTSDVVLEGVEASKDLGYGIGVYSTPAFIIGGTPVMGAQPTEVFVQTVEEALEQAEG